MVHIAMPVASQNVYEPARSYTEFANVECAAMQPSPALLTHLPVANARGAIMVARTSAY